MPGSGKSYFDSRLSEKINAVYVNSDELRWKLFRERTYSDAEKLLVYDSMMEMMNDAIQNKKSIVLDATFYKEELRNKIGK